MFFVIIGLMIYFIPTVVASWRGHQSTAAIFVVNLLGAWTVILWLVALVWALTGVRGPIMIQAGPGYEPPRFWAPEPKPVEQPNNFAAWVIVGLILLAVVASAIPML